MYFAFCENKLSFISFNPLYDLYCDCNVYQIKYNSNIIFELIQCMYDNNDENYFMYVLNQNNVKYKYKYYGM